MVFRLVKKQRPNVCHRSSVSSVPALENFLRTPTVA